jgi:hypothetical protein
MPGILLAHDDSSELPFDKNADRHVQVLAQRCKLTGRRHAV